jgi:hypothetical protein
MIFGKQVLILLEFIDNRRGSGLSVGRSWGRMEVGFGLGFGAGGVFRLTIAY